MRSLHLSLDEGDCSFNRILGSWGT